MYVFFKWLKLNKAYNLPDKKSDGIDRFFCHYVKISFYNLLKKFFSQIQNYFLMKKMTKNSDQLAAGRINMTQLRGVSVEFQSIKVPT